jgi:NAD(P)-dependent dehydrogenase (short-subunit alcohol dehydrogenase family)
MRASQGKSLLEELGAKMDLGLQGKLAVVSGSTAGIGFAIAATLAAEGAKVVVNGRTQARVDAALKSIQKHVARADLRGVAADLGTAAGIESFLRQIPNADVLVNNLGIFDVKPFLEIPDAEWLRFFEVNVLSGVRLARAYLPGMLKKNWGRIIFISSESAQHIPAEMIHYGMTKTAQVAVGRGLAESIAGTGVTVNSVLAGPTASEGASKFLENMAKQQKVSTAEIEKQFFASARPTSLLKRFETPEEIATVVAFVASTQSIAINGAAVRAEGGVVRSIF